MSTGQAAPRRNPVLVGLAAAIAALDIAALVLALVLNADTSGDRRSSPASSGQTTVPGLAQPTPVYAARKVPITLDHDGAYVYTTPLVRSITSMDQVSSYGAGQSVLGGTAEITNFVAIPHFSPAGMTMVITFNVRARSGSPVLEIVAAGVDIR